MADHRRAHRRGVPAKIATDPELQAFVSARFDTLTLHQIAREVAENFTYERRVSRPPPHRWWLKTRSIRGGALAGSWTFLVNPDENALRLALPA